MSRRIIVYSQRISSTNGRSSLFGDWSSIRGRPVRGPSIERRLTTGGRTAKERRRLPERRKTTTNDGRCVLWRRLKDRAPEVPPTAGTRAGPLGSRQGPGEGGPRPPSPAFRAARRRPRRSVGPARCGRALQSVKVAAACLVLSGSGVGVGSVVVGDAGCRGKGPREMPRGVERWPSTRERGFRLAPEADMFTVLHPRPRGMLLMTICRAAGLRGMDTSVVGPLVARPFPKIIVLPW